MLNRKMFLGRLWQYYFVICVAGLTVPVQGQMDQRLLRYKTEPIPIRPLMQRELRNGMLPALTRSNTQQISLLINTIADNVFYVVGEHSEEKIKPLLLNVALLLLYYYYLINTALS